MQSLLLIGLKINTVEIKKIFVECVAIKNFQFNLQKTEKNVFKNVE